MRRVKVGGEHRFSDRQEARRLIFGLLVVLLTGVTAIVSIFLLMGSLAVFVNRDAVGERVGPQCTIAFDGTGTTVTVQGWTAPGACDAIIGLWASLHSARSVAYRPETNVLCRYELGGNLYTVRDPNPLWPYGGTLCDSLRHRSEGTKTDLRASVPSSTFG